MLAAHCIRIGEVAAALKKMKRHKVPDLSGLTAEIIQAIEGIGTQWLLWPPYVIGGNYIFALWLLSFFPCLISAAGDWMSTILPHMVWP